MQDVHSAQHPINKLEGAQIATQVVMNCPQCSIELKMGDRQGVEVNYCPTCRGVWIDRGGLDKIIERCAALSAGSRSYDRHDDDEHDYDEHGHHGELEHGRHRRRGFLSSLFD